VEIGKIAPYHNNRLLASGLHGTSLVHGAGTGREQDGDAQVAQGVARDGETSGNKQQDDQLNVVLNDCSSYES
jgi:hypothetical protein